MYATVRVQSRKQRADAQALAGGGRALVVPEHRVARGARRRTREAEADVQQAVSEIVVFRLRTHNFAIRLFASSCTRIFVNEITR